jgi:two-component system, NarL family, response regulator LiaR
MRSTVMTVDPMVGQRITNGVKGAPRLLVVDDAVPIRQAVRDLAMEIGYLVIGEATNGFDAVIAAVRLDPHVVVMDWSMAELDGVQATRAIHARRPTIDVIAFSSGDEEMLAPAFAAAGASAYVHKSDIDGLVDELLRRAPQPGTPRRTCPG